LKAALHPRPLPHQITAMKALANGLQLHGIEATVTGPTNLGGADFHVIWESRYLSLFCDKPVLMLGGAYTTGTGPNYNANRLHLVSSSWDQSNGEALSGPKRPADRWLGLGIELLPWTDRDGYTLILGQLPGDLAVPDNYTSVLMGMRKAASEHYGKVRMRPHPLVEVQQRSLSDDLGGAERAITWCSTSAVEAVIAGVPTITFHPSAIAWPVTSHALGDPPYLGERDQWCYDLAYRQWSLEALANGEAWEHIRYGLAANGSA
jgi:hypothetical protein